MTGFGLECVCCAGIPFGGESVYEVFGSLRNTPLPVGGALAAVSMEAQLPDDAVKQKPDIVLHEGRRLHQFTVKHHGTHTRLCTYTHRYTHTDTKKTQTTAD